METPRATPEVFSPSSCPEVSIDGPPENPDQGPLGADVLLEQAAASGANRPGDGADDSKTGLQAFFRWAADRQDNLPQAGQVWGRSG